MLANGSLDDITYADYRDFRDRSTTLAGLAAYNGTSMAIDDRAGPTRAWVSYVSDDFFDVLGVHAAIGRVFREAEAGRNAGELVTVIGYRLWQTRYHGDSSVVGHVLEINDKPYTVIGIAPRGFVGAMRLHEMDLWTPLDLLGQTVDANRLVDDRATARAVGWLRVVGRLAPGRSVDDAQRDLSAISNGLSETYRDDKGRGVRVFEDAGMTDDERADMRRMPALLAIAMALLLLIACANVASLTLIRAAAKRRELATRLALGASRASLVRQLTMEGGLLALAAAVAGVGLARLVVQSPAIVQSVADMYDMDLSIDSRVLAVVAAIAVATAMLVSIVPAFQVSRTNVGLLMKDGTGGAVRRSRGQRVLVLLQVAASLVLLASASILYGAFQRLLETPLGYDTRGLAWVAFDFKSKTYDTLARRRLDEEVVQRAGALPGISGIALTSTVPPATWGWRVRLFRRGEEPAREVLAAPNFSGGLRAFVDGVSPGMFDLMRIPIVAGRNFTRDDDAGQARVAIVSRALAVALWVNESPIGKYVAWPSASGAARPPVQVVGVAADTRHESVMSPPSLVMYLPLSQNAQFEPTILFRTPANPKDAMAAIRRVAREVDPNVGVLDGRTIDHDVDRSLGPQRTASLWVSVFGMVALGLAAIGLYAIVAQGVLQRTRELAVRAALGASPGGLIKLVIRDGLVLGAGGGVVGLLAAAGAFAMLRHAFSGLAWADAGASVLALGMLGVAVLFASYLPARRAAALDPAMVLRAD